MDLVWEYCAVQLRWPELAGGANKSSLIEAQLNYETYRSAEKRVREFVRPPTVGEPLEPGWRVIDSRLDNFEQIGDNRTPWPEDLTVLYWWRHSFWRKRL